MLESTPNTKWSTVDTQLVKQKELKVDISAQEPASVRAGYQHKTFTLTPFAFRNAA